MRHTLEILLASMMRRADVELEEAKGRVHAMNQDGRNMETLDQGRNWDEAEMALNYARERSAMTAQIVSEIEAEVLGSPVQERPEPPGPGDVVKTRGFADPR